MAGIDEYTIFIIHGNEIADASQYKHEITNNGVIVSTDQSKFNGKSLYFGNSVYLTANIPDIFAGVADWTVDWWEYRTSNNTNGAVVSKTFAANGGLGILIGQDISNNLYFFGSGGSQWDVAPSTLMGTQILNTWVHRAVTRNFGTIRTFENGELKAEVPSSASIGATTQPLTVGRYDFQSGGYYPGYISEFRISNIARWTENFIPPAAPYSWQKPPDYLLASPNEPLVGDEITLTWTGGKLESGNWVIERKSSNDDWVKIKTVSYHESTTTDTAIYGVTRYRIKGVDGNEETDYCESNIMIGRSNPILNPKYVYGGGL